VSPGRGLTSQRKRPRTSRSSGVARAIDGFGRTRNERGSAGLGSTLGVQRRCAFRPLGRPVISVLPGEAGNGR
jgi:hypothetical protein